MRKVICVGALSLGMFPPADKIRVAVGPSNRIVPTGRCQDGLLLKIQKPAKQRNNDSPISLLDRGGYEK
jgi:hypothetical protein